MALLLRFQKPRRKINKIKDNRSKGLVPSKRYCQADLTEYSVSYNDGIDQVNKIKSSQEKFIMFVQVPRELSRDSDGHEIGLVY